MAPHGVPSAPMPRALSSSKLEEDELTVEQQMAAARQGPNLGVPGMQSNDSSFANTCCFQFFYLFQSYVYLFWIYDYIIFYSHPVPIWQIMNTTRVKSCG